MNATRSPEKPRKVTAIIVAYNRAELLKECLDAIAEQTQKPTQVLVIDNASTDQTAQIAKQHPIVTETIHLPENTGGAGGFTAGIAHALSQNQLGNRDYLWIMDDDTIPQPDTLAELLKAMREYPGQPALAASQAIWIDGSVHPMNTHRQRPLINRKSLKAAQQIHCLPVRAASFVSILIEVGQIQASGLPIADYFIWNDDLEYTARILKHRVGLYVPASIVLHKTKALASATDAPGDRFFYEVRNKLWFLRHSTGLHPQDRILYGASMLVRWAKIFYRSQNRKETWEMAKKGWKAHLKPPKANWKIFTNHAQTARLVSRYDRAASGALPGKEYC